MGDPKAPPPRHVTAGRPLPPRKSPPIGPAANDLPIAQVAAVAPAPAATIAAPAIAATAPAVAIERMRPEPPNPRPMRWAFGAGAVAAMSVMAVGFVRPDFGGTADQPTDTNALASDTAAEANGAAQPGTRVRVRRVTEYVFLAPGERAPRGATVIAPEDTQQRPDRQPASRREPAGQRQDRPETQAQSPRRQPAQPAAQPPPAPPRVTTRQSGG